MQCQCSRVGHPLYERTSFSLPAWRSNKYKYAFADQVINKIIVLVCSKELIEYLESNNKKIAKNILNHYKQMKKETVILPISIG